MIETRAGQRYHEQGKILPAMVFVQVLIAAAALAAMVFVALQIRPLLEEKAQLETDIAGLESKLEADQQKMEVLRQELADTRETLAEARERLAETFNMTRYEHPLDLVDMKIISSRFPAASNALRLMDRLRQDGVGWYLGGQTPEQGFDSPGFAAYVLAELNAIDAGFRPGEDLLATSQRLINSFPPVDEPDVGDLVFYPGGYVLFYFVDENDQPFVIGMTPSGIASLNPDFAIPLGYRRSGLGG